jgi:hypothetical protein
MWLFKMCARTLFLISILGLSAIVAAIGTTGQRDTTVLFEFMSRSEGPDSEAGLKAGWVQDPYDPTQVSPMTMNQSEHAEYDAMFPDHPLSRARRILAHLEETVLLSEAVKGSRRFRLNKAEG